VADQKNHAIREVSGGVVSTLSGGTAAAANGPGRPNAGTVAGIAAQFAFPSNVTVLAGAVYATERDNHCIRKIDIATGNTSVFAGGPAPGLTDGPALSARFRSVEDTAVDASGDVYVADETNNCVHKIDTSGNVTTIGSGIAGSVDGGPTTAQFYFPTGVAVDLTGIVYVADRKNGLIRRIDLAGNVTTYAGGGYGWIDANGLSAQFRNPAGVAVDASGNVYVADESNQDIRKIDTALNVTTIAGPTGGGGHATGSNNGSAAAATFNDPYHIALDTAGNLYIAEPSNCDIRRLTPAGLVSTVAGIAGNGGFQDGPGAIAQFSQPTGIACDGGGNLHVGDSGNSMLRKIDPLGYVVSLAGQSNNEGYANGIGLGAIFSHPEGLSVDASGVLYVADRDNHVVRVIH
jgi:sugar lactone lactonase YvrE